MTNPVVQTVPLGQQWPTLDPFLFCAHHDDDYPAGDEALAPAVPVEDRELGQDFSNQDGWNMYHGDLVPGFPNHPHRGFETVTFVRTGIIDHADSLGAAAGLGRGDVQWLTAGRGIVHSEMFPLLEQNKPNPLELFQIWLNLPAKDKLVDPYFTMFWADDIPQHVVEDGEGRSATVTVIAGTFSGVSAPPPPPNSWAAQPESDVAIWHLRLDPGASMVLPAANSASSNRVLYIFEGETLDVAGTEVEAGNGAQLVADINVALTAGKAEVEALVLQGKPIGEPVAQYGPFAMNTQAEIEQAFKDYQASQFGGWPWDSEAPDHGRDQGRFARHVDGRMEVPEPADS